MFVCESLIHTEWRRLVFKETAALEGIFEKLSWRVGRPGSHATDTTCGRCSLQVTFHRSQELCTQREYVFTEDILNA